MEMAFIIICALLVYCFACFTWRHSGSYFDYTDCFAGSVICFLVLILLFMWANEVGKEQALQKVSKDFLNGKIQYRINNTIENNEIIKADTIFYYKQN